MAKGRIRPSDRVVLTKKQQGERDIEFQLRREILYILYRGFKEYSYNTICSSSLPTNKILNKYICTCRIKCQTQWETKKVKQVPTTQDSSGSANQWRFMVLSLPEQISLCVILCQNSSYKVSPLSNTSRWQMCVLYFSNGPRFYASWYYSVAETSEPKLWWSSPCIGTWLPICKGHNRLWWRVQSESYTVSILECHRDLCLTHFCSWKINDLPNAISVIVNLFADDILLHYSVGQSMIN